MSFDLWPPELSLRDQLYQLNVPKPTWPDGIHPKVLNELADVTAGPASTIYQGSRETADVPAEWKLVSVILIYKKGMRGNLENYKPVKAQSLEKSQRR